ncbi:hypothetical protein ACHQM5_008948 [Ranunculus cassubicifolius]
MAAFISKMGNLLKQNVVKNTVSTFSATNQSLFQAIRHMSSSKIFVGGLSYNTDEPSLREAFSSYGEVIETRVIMDRETGRSRGFGFISFTSSEEASSAVQAMDGKDLHGRTVRVNFATERVGGGGGGYGGGGGGYGGGGGGYGGGGGGYGGGGGGYGGGGGGGYGESGGYDNRSSGGSYGGSTEGGNAGGDSNYANGATYGGDFGGASNSAGEGTSHNYNSDVGGSVGAGGFSHDEPLEATNK